MLRATQLRASSCLQRSAGSVRRHVAPPAAVQLIATSPGSSCPAAARRATTRAQMPAGPHSEAEKEKGMSMQVAGAAGAMAAAVAASNYLVLFPFNDWFTAGTLSYPATFLLTDLTNRQLGKAAADKVVLAGFLVAMPISWYLSGPRIAIASGTAYLSSQLLDVRIFDRLRHRSWWMAPLVSTTIASAVDSSLFVSIAFLGLPVPWVTWGIGDFGMKVGMAVVMLLPFRALTTGRGWAPASANAVSWSRAASKYLKNVGGRGQRGVRDGGGKNLRVFEATQEWQRVEDDHVLPPGLEISLDVSTGERVARLPPTLAGTHAQSSAAAGGTTDAGSGAHRDEVEDGPVREGAGAEEPPAYIPDVTVEDFDYELPAHRIAVRPCEPRHASKLLVCTPGVEGEHLGPRSRPIDEPVRGEEREWRIRDHVFADAPEVIPAGALLVMNDSKVIAGRLLARKPSGGKAEVMLIAPDTLDDVPVLDPAQAFRAASGSCVWSCMIRGRNIHVGDVLECDGGGTALQGPEGAAGSRLVRLEAKVEAKQGADAAVRLIWHTQAGSELRLGEVLEEVGRVPLPPYMKREADRQDLVSYQTPHATREGSVAAPTAGLHFSREIVAAMRARGVATCELTLHVGAGTFRPMDCASTREHTMHAEWVSVSRDALLALLQAVQEERPIVPVGTTSVRTLESVYWWGVKLLRDDGGGSAAGGGAPSAQDFMTVEQWDPYRLQHLAGGWDKLPAVSVALEEVRRWAQARAEQGGAGGGAVVGQTQLLIVPGYRFALVDLVSLDAWLCVSVLSLCLSGLALAFARACPGIHHAACASVCVGLRPRRVSVCVSFPAAFYCFGRTCAWDCTSVCT